MTYTTGDMQSMRVSAYKRGIYRGVFLVLGGIGAMALVGGVIINSYMGSL